MKRGTMVTEKTIRTRRTKGKKETGTRRTRGNKG